MVEALTHNPLRPEVKEADSGTETGAAAPIGIKSSIVLFCFALAFRMIYVIQSADNPLFGVPVVDAYSYNEWAKRMLDGIWLWDNVGNYLPIYSAFLAFQQILFGPDPIVNKVLQSILGAGAAVLFAQVAAHAWNRRVGLISGYLIATYWMLVIFDSEKFAETFSIFFLSLTLWLLIRHYRRNGAIFIAGIVFALSAGARANLFLILPCVLVWLLWTRRSRRGAAILAAVLFACGTVFIIGPIVARNYYLVGTPMLRAQATWSLYSGLAPEFKGLHPPAGILFDKYMDMPAREGAYSEGEVENYWGRKLKEVIKADPAGVAMNLIRRVLIFANAREWSQEFDVAAYRSYSRFLSLPWTGFWLIGPLGFLGLFLCRRLTGEQSLIILVTLAVIVSTVPFKASDRYRLPTAVLLTMFAALTLWYLYMWIRQKDWRSLVKWLAAGSVFCLICWPDWQDLTARKSARHYFFVGKHYEKTGRFNEAIMAYERSMNEFAWDADSAYRLGLIYTLQGKQQLSADYLNEALEREPAFPRVLNELARHHLRDNELTAAEEQLRLSLNYAPADLDAMLLMAEVQRRQGDIENELKYLNDAVVKTRTSRPAMLLADRYVVLGDHRRAVGLYDGVMRSRTVDKFVRVTAAMMAGFTTARYLSPEFDDKAYWHYVINEFDQFRFFALQAKFLAGSLPAEDFRTRMGDSPSWKVSAEYAIGLDRKLNGDALGAARAFKRCLQIDDPAKSRNQYSPQKWAQEDLERIEAAALTVQGQEAD